MPVLRVLDVIGAAAAAVPVSTDAEGVIRVAPDLSFNAETLQAKSEEAISLQQYCQAVGVDVVAALTGMASAVGHPGLASALTDGAGRGDTAFSGMTAAYGHAYRGIVGAAQTLGGADQRITGMVGMIGRG